MHVRFAALALSMVLGAGLSAVWSPRTPAAPSGALKARGKAILQEKCGRCHAIGATGASPEPKAPPMREIYARFSPRELQAELTEGLVSKARHMPQIDFSDEEVDAILAYLYALAVRR